MDDSPEQLLQRGKLEQTCPACGRREAAGGYCTQCGHPTGPADWYRNQDMAARREARQQAPEIPQPRVKRGRPRKSGQSPTVAAS